MNKQIDKFDDLSEEEHIEFVLKRSDIKAHNLESMSIDATNFGDLPWDVSESLRGETYCDIPIYRVGTNTPSHTYGD